MYRKPRPRQETCFIPGSLSDYVPEDHILKRVHAVLDLSWLAEEVKDLYAEGGWPCIDPERAVRVMLAGFFHGVVHDRALVREAQVNLAYRWFAGYALDEALPEHSSLTRIRQRWGEDRFRRIFERTVTQCVQAGLVGGQTLHVDASLIRADVSWSSLVPAHVARVWAENEASEEAPAPKKISTTDPEASLATSNPGQRLEPSYKQHTAVDDRAGVIVDVQVTTGAESESRKLLAQVQQVQAQLGVTPQVVTADRGYASSANYAALEQAGIQGVIPPQPEATSRRGVPLRRFAYDAKHDCARCPAGKRLTRRNRSAHGWFYRAGPGLPGLSAAGAVRAHHGSGAKPAHSRRIPGPLAGATALRARLARGVRKLVPTSPRLGRRSTRRGEDPTRVTPSRTPRPREHAHSGRT